MNELYVDLIFFGRNFKDEYRVSLTEFVCSFKWKNRFEVVLYSEMGNCVDKNTKNRGETQGTNRQLNGRSLTMPPTFGKQSAEDV